MANAVESSRRPMGRGTCSGSIREEWAERRELAFREYESEPERRPSAFGQPTKDGNDQGRQGEELDRPTKTVGR
ncbi:hypothetical protein N9L68_05425 [bacterium]|nr:hypothetical protein [bacterium]